MASVEIILENASDPVYVAGDTVKGQIKLKVNEAMRIRSLVLIVRGVNCCSWKNFEHVGELTAANLKLEVMMERYNGLKQALLCNKFLIGSRNGQEVDVEAGETVFDFKVMLPRELPESIYVKYGHIYYYVEASLKCLWSPDESVIQPITVISNNDVALLPDLNSDRRAEVQKKFCWLFCRPKSLKLKVEILSLNPSRPLLFTPGSKIRMVIEYINKGNIRVKRTIVRLMQIIRYKSNRPPYSENNPQVKIEATTITRQVALGTNGSVVSSERLTLSIPDDVIASTNVHSDILKVYYEINVEAELPGCRWNFDVSIPITLIRIVPLDFIAIQNPVSPVRVGHSPKNYGSLDEIMVARSPPIPIKFDELPRNVSHRPNFVNWRSPPPEFPTEDDDDDDSS